MATTGSINGKLLGVKVDGTLVAYSKGCKLTYTHDVRDTTTKDDNGVKSVAEGMTSWKVDVDGLVVEGSNFTTLFSSIKGRTKVTLSFTSSVSGDKKYSGSAYVSSLDQDAPDQQSTTFSASFEGTGALTESAVS
jgi:predicted secreted protein